MTPNKLTWEQIPSAIKDAIDSHVANVRIRLKLANEIMAASQQIALSVQGPVWVKAVNGLPKDYANYFRIECKIDITK